MEKVDLPDDPQIAGAIIQGQFAETHKRLEIGLVGKLLGGTTEKPGNIAFLVIAFFGLTFACFLIWGGDSPSLTKKDALAFIGGFITLALGYIFGRSSKE